VCHGVRVGRSLRRHALMPTCDLTAFACSLSICYHGWQDVAAQLCSLAEVTEVPRVQVFYLEEGLAVEAHCRMLEHLTVTELRDVARRGREALLDNSPDITSAAVSLDLSERWSPASSGSNLSEKSASLR